MGSAWHYRERIRSAPLLGKGGVEAAASGTAAGQASYERPILESDIVEAIADSQWILDYGTGDDAVQYSRSCFSGLRSYPTLRLLDRCIAFDFAWKHQLRGVATTSQSDYFAASAMRARHFGTAHSLPEGEAMNEARLKSLEALTITVLSRLLGRSVATSGDGG